jgi:hypothetical protein
VTKLTDAGNLLAHYTRADTAFDRILPSGMLRMNPYSRMRDPFEYKEPMILSAGSIGSDHDTDNRIWFLMQNAVSRSKDPYCLLSLTQGIGSAAYGREEVFRCPWARARMWEQYAENHAGVCLVFDRQELVEAITHNLASEGSYRHGPVHYTLAGFGTAAGASVSLSDFSPDSVQDDVAIHVQRHHRDFFFLKTLDWATEYEYRFVWRPADEYRGEPPIHHVSYGDALRWVVVGEKFPNWQLPAARELTERAGAELKAMTWDLNFPYPGNAEPGQDL